MASMRLRPALSLAIVLAACSGGASAPPGGATGSGTGVDASTPMVQADGPLRGLVLTEELAKDGSATAPRLSFTTEDQRVTALVGLGSDVGTGSTLRVAWYRLTEIDGREELFTHEIPVGPGGSAFSEGLAAGGLAPGVYLTVATLGEREVRMPWVVRIAESGSARDQSGGVSGAAQPATGDEDWNVPDGGDSGWNEPSGPDEPPPPPGPCEVLRVFAGFEPFADVSASASWQGTCSSMTLAATVSGPALPIASVSEIDPARLPFLAGAAGLCDLPGGSDLPGTVVHLTATWSEGATGTAYFTVPDFGETLEALVQSIPDPGVRVEPGQRIRLRGMAVVMPAALGVEKVSLRAGDQLIDEVGNASETSSPEPCDFGRLGAVDRTSFTVPQNPPAVLEICADARGFDGTKASHCIEFYTGEVWQGEVTGDAVQAQCSPPSVPLSGEIRLVVAPDGTVSGTVTERRDGFTCAGTPVPAFEGNYTVTGTKTATAFELTATGTGSRTVTVPIDGDRATVTIDEVNEGYGATVVYTLRCVTCGTG